MARAALPLLLPLSLVLTPVVGAQPTEQPCRIWSVPEAMSYKGLCKVTRQGASTTLNAPHALSGERKTIELNPRGRRKVEVMGRSDNGVDNSWGEARKVGKSGWVGPDFVLCL